MTIKLIYVKYRYLHTQKKVQLGERKDFDWNYDGLIPLYAIIFFPFMFSCRHTSLYLNNQGQNDYSMNNQMQYTGLRQGFHLCIPSKLFKSSRTGFKLFSYCVLKMQIKQQELEYVGINVGLWPWLKPLVLFLPLLILLQ